MVEKGKASGIKTLQFCKNVLWASKPKPWYMVKEAHFVCRLRPFQTSDCNETYKESAHANFHPNPSLLIATFSLTSANSWYLPTKLQPVEEAHFVRRLRL